MGESCCFVQGVTPFRVKLAGSYIRPLWGAMVPTRCLAAADSLVQCQHSRPRLPVGVQPLLQLVPRLQRHHRQRWWLLVWWAVGVRGKKENTSLALCQTHQRRSVSSSQCCCASTVRAASGNPNCEGRCDVSGSTADVHTAPDQGGRPVMKIVKEFPLARRPACAPAVVNRSRVGPNCEGHCGVGVGAHSAPDQGGPCSLEHRR